MLQTVEELAIKGRATREGECLIWNLSRVGKGYGQVYDPRERYVHRLAMLLDGRPLAPGQQAAHRCGNPACFEPSHLYAATQAENERDKIRHGTYNHGAAGVGYCGKWLTNVPTGPRCRRKPHAGPCDVDPTWREKDGRVTCPRCGVTLRSYLPRHQSRRRCRARDLAAIDQEPEDDHTEIPRGAA